VTPFAEAVAAVADDAECPELAAAVRAAQGEAAVLAAIAATVTDAIKLRLVRMGLFDAVVDHAADGFGALPQTGQALVLPTPTAAQDIPDHAHTAVAHPHTVSIDTTQSELESVLDSTRAGARIARASPGVHELVLSGCGVPPRVLAEALEDVAAIS